MKEEEELNCPSCKKEYTEANPPRILTMCGHTFCQTCLKVMIVKKKDANFRLKCPQDKQSIDLQSSSPNCFPKNMALLQLLIRRRKSVIFDRKSQIKDEGKPAKVDLDQSKNQFLSINHGKRESLFSKNNGSKCKTQMKDEDLREVNDEKEMEKCLLHQKQLDIICLFDKEKICSDCALFGRHKGHHFCSVKQLQTNKCQFYRSVLEIMEQKQFIQSKLSNQEIQSEIIGLMDKKREHICQEIKTQFKKMREKLLACEEKLIQESKDYFDQIGKRLANTTCLKEDLRMAYTKWQCHALKQLKYLDVKDSKKQFQLMINGEKKKELIYHGTQLVQEMKKQEQTLIENVQQIIQSAKIETRKELLMQIQGYCYFVQDKSLAIFQENIQLGNKSHISIFGDISMEAFDQISLLESNNNGFGAKMQKQANQNIENLNLTMQPLKPMQKVRKNISRQLEPLNLSMIENSTKKRISENSSSAKLRQRMSSIKLINSPSSTFFKSLLAQKACLKFKALQKYQKAINSIQNELTQAIDLYGAEVGDGIMKEIFKKVKQNSKIKAVRLVKNDLTDQIARQAIESLQKIDMLSLAQNNFTDKFIDLLHEAAKNMKFTSSKSVLLGQNKIVVRKCKEKIEELKKMNINIIL